MNIVEPLLDLGNSDIIY